MSRNYKFHNPNAAYFVSFVPKAFGIKWLPVFTKKEYIDIVLNCLRFCQKNKGMEIYSWIIMPNHMHLVFQSMDGQPPELLLGDFKRFTSNAIVKAIKENPEELNREFYLARFRVSASKSSNVKHHQFWRHDNRPIELWSNHVIAQKIRYIHNNPVVAGLVNYPEDYEYSSAVDYSGEKGVVGWCCFGGYLSIRI